MNPIMKNTVLSIILCLSFSIACTQYEDISSCEQSESPSLTTRSGAVVSDQNPYSLANVQEAYNDLRPTLGLPAKTLTATDHYVRFFVTDSVDHAILHDSLHLELIEYPLDVELTADEMASYMSTATNMWYYTVVHPDFVYPEDIEYEFLDYIYMQSDPIMRAPSFVPQIDDEDYTPVIERAMINNGINISPLTRGAVWYPSATIYYEDDYNGEIIPLEGVKVRCTNFINVGSGITDADGNVSGITGWGGRFRNAVGYHIIWEDSQWNIRDGRTGQAKTHGPKQKAHWDHTISTDDTKDSAFAAVHRALHAFYYESHPLTAGITKMHPFYYPIMNVGIITNRTNNGKNGYFLSSFIRDYGFNSIVVWLNNRDKWEVTATTFHELGHANHYQASLLSDGGLFDWINYFCANGLIVDSWANGLRYAYMESFYPGIELSLQNHPDYTHIIESLMNQGFSLSQLENTVVNTTSVSSWRQKVKNVNSVPDAIVDMIFDNPYTPVRVNLSNPISGSNAPAINTNVTYSVPNDLPTGVTFNGWTTSGVGCLVIGGTSGSTLTVRFSGYTTYTLTANFTLPGNVPYSVTKTIDLTSYAPVATPTISANKSSLTSWGESVTFSVTSPQLSVTYEWQNDRVTQPNQTGPALTLTTSTGSNTPPILDDPGITPHALASPGFTVRCRAVGGQGQTSSWSNEIFVPFYEPAINNSI
jgi:hypothetical protein